MDPLHERLDALESQVQALTQHASTVTRRLRWWRGLARGLAVLGLLGWGLPLGLAGEEDRQQELGVQAQPLTEQSQQLLELKAQNESLRVALEQQNAELAARLARLEEATARTDKDKDQEGLAQRVAALEQQSADLAARLARLEEATARTDKDKDQEGLAQRVAALEQLLEPLSREQNEIFITGANLHIVNGLGQTDCGPVPDCPNGLGNLIVG
jgi:DNA repair exonuclease SbcCD ATPase subunit